MDANQSLSQDLNEDNLAWFGDFEQLQEWNNGFGLESEAQNQPNAANSQQLQNQADQEQAFLEDSAHWQDGAVGMTQEQLEAFIRAGFVTSDGETAEDSSAQNHPQDRAQNSTVNFELPRPQPPSQPPQIPTSASGIPPVSASQDHQGNHRPKGKEREHSSGQLVRPARELPTPPACPHQQSDPRQNQINLGSGSYLPGLEAHQWEAGILESGHDQTNSHQHQTAPFNVRHSGGQQASQGAAPGRAPQQQETLAFGSLSASRSKATAPAAATAPSQPRSSIQSQDDQVNPVVEDVLRHGRTKVIMARNLRDQVKKARRNISNFDYPDPKVSSATPTVPARPPQPPAQAPGEAHAPQPHFAAASASQHPAGSERAESSAIDLTMNSDSEDAPANAPPQRSAHIKVIKKRRLSNAADSTAKRVNMIGGMAQVHEQTIDQKLVSFQRFMDTATTPEVANSSAQAMQQISSVGDARAFLANQAARSKTHSLGISALEENVHWLEDPDMLMHIRHTMLANLLCPPQPAPLEYQYRHEYDSDHQAQYQMLQRTMQHDHSHLEASSKILLLIEKVKSIHTFGIPMFELHNAEYSEEEIDNDDLGDNVFTIKGGYEINHDLTCIDRLFAIAQVIKSNKWMANDILNATSSDDYLNLVCSPFKCLDRKTESWERRFKKRQDKSDKALWQARHDSEHDERVAAA